MKRKMKMKTKNRQNKMKMKTKMKMKMKKAKAKRMKMKSRTNRTQERKTKKTNLKNNQRRKSCPHSNSLLSLKSLNFNPFYRKFQASALPSITSSTLSLLMAAQLIDLSKSQNKPFNFPDLPLFLTLHLKNIL